MTNDNIEKTLATKEDRKYKQAVISSQSKTGEDDTFYPTVGAVRDFVNYIKTDLEDYYDSELDKCVTKQELKEEVSSLFPIFQDISYRTNEIIGTTDPGYDSTHYPSIAAVKQGLNDIYTSVKEDIPEDISALNNDMEYVTEVDLDKKEDVSKRTSRISDSTTVAYDQTHYPNIYAIKNAGFKKKFYDKKEILHQSGPEDVIIGTYRLADDLCTIVGSVKVKAGKKNMQYKLPTPVKHNAATIAVNGSIHYSISTNNNNNNSILLIQDMNNDTITENATIQFVITYKYK